MIASSRLRPDLATRGRGFTLVELAVAIGVLALLIGGLLIPLAGQLELSQQREAQRQLETIREALIGYAIANGRLPCPADPTLATIAANAGRAVTNGIDPNHPVPATRNQFTCGAAVMSSTAATSGFAWDAVPPGGSANYRGSPRRAMGVIPWADLGVPELDPWGRRFTYMVEEVYANVGVAPNPPAPYGPLPAECMSAVPTISAATFCADSLSPSANLWVGTKQTGAPTPSAQALNLVAVVVSHGKNGYYAFANNGAVALVPGSPNRDERRNAAWNGQPAAQSEVPYAVDRPLIRVSTACDDFNAGQPLCEFDDQLVWISRSLLVARMAAASRL